MKKLTKRQQEVFDFLKAFIETRGYPPTYKEIGDHFNISAMTAKRHLHGIEKKGFIDMPVGKRRSIRVNENIKVKAPLEIYQAIGASADGQIEDGDYVYLRGGRLTGITREIL